MNTKGVKCGQTGGTEMIVPGYNEQYDAFYNPETREWKEGKCSDPECEYCRNRPDKAPVEEQK